MAAIDSLLTLIDAQQASGIVLRARETPVLIGGKGRGLTMPALDLLTIETFVEEVLTVAERETLLASGGCDTTYRSERQGSFTVEARRSADNLSLKLRRGGGTQFLKNRECLPLLGFGSVPCEHVGVLIRTAQSLPRACRALPVA